MPAPKNNQFWKARAKSGRDAIFQTPQQLMDAACEYFEWIDKNPLKEQKLTGGGKKVNMNLMRPYTKPGMCIFMGVHEDYWREFAKAKKEDNDFSPVIKQIENIIYTQKFEGAAAGLLNSNIIARDLGLAEKSELSGPGGAPMQHNTTIQIGYGSEDTED